MLTLLFLSVIETLVVELIRMFPQLSVDIGPKFARYLSALDSDHDISAWQIVKDIYDGETAHSLTWEIKGTRKEHTQITVAAVHFHVVLHRETLELDR